MVTQAEVEEQLKAIGVSFGLRGDITNKLRYVLRPGEHVTYAIKGYYNGVFAVLCVTNLRVMIVRKTARSSAIVDLHYDMLAKVTYSRRALVGQVLMSTPIQSIVFATWAASRLREGTHYIHQRLFDIRNDPRFWEHQFEISSSNEASLVTSETPVSPSQVRSSIERDRLQADEFGYIEPPMALFHTPSPFVKVPALSRRRRFPSYY